MLKRTSLFGTQKNQTCLRLGMPTTDWSMITRMYRLKGSGRRFGNLNSMKGLKSFYGGLQLTAFPPIRISGTEYLKGTMNACFAGQKNNRLLTSL